MLTYHMRLGLPRALLDICRIQKRSARRSRSLTTCPPVRRATGTWDNDLAEQKGSVCLNPGAIVLCAGIFQCMEVDNLVSTSPEQYKMVTELERGSEDGRLFVLSSRVTLGSARSISSLPPTLSHTVSIFTELFAIT